MLRTLTVPTARAAKSSRERTVYARLLFGVLVAAVCVTPGQAAAADRVQIGLINVDGPSVRVAVPIVDPVACGSTLDENWPPVCVLITDQNDPPTYSLFARLKHDPAEAYYDADEDLVHPYRGEFVRQGGQGASTGVASLELTVTKEGREAGVLSISLDGLDQVPNGTTLSVELLPSDPS